MGYMCKSNVGTIRFSVCMGPTISRDFDLFIEVFKNRVSQFYKKKWYDATRNSSKLAVYTTYKYELEPERYLDVLCIRKYFVALSRLRCSSHNLRIESERHNNTVLAKRICTLCNL